MYRENGSGAGEVAARYLAPALPVLAAFAIYSAFLIGILNISYATLGVESGLDRYLRISIIGRPFTALLVGVFMLFLSYQLWLRKRAALLLLSLFLLATAAANLASGNFGTECALLLGGGVLFLVPIGEYPARPDPASYRRLELALPLMAALFGWGLAGLYMLRDGVGLRGAGVFALARAELLMVFGSGGGAFSGWASLYRDLMALLTLLGLAYLTVLLFRPCRETAEGAGTDLEKARRLVERYGSDSLSYFCLRSGKHLFFGPGDSFLAYRVIGDWALVSGDPVGPRESLPGIIEGFGAYCRDRGWRLAVIGAGDELSGGYEEAGYRSLVVGEEPVIDLSGFTLEGRGVRKLRQSVNKMKKAGITMEFTYNAGIPSHQRHELRRMSEEWRGGKPETGFSMGLGRLLDPSDEDCLLAVAYDCLDHPIGFLYFTPMYPRQGYSLDITRARTDAPGDLSDYMFARTALFLKEIGYRYMTLHFLAFSQHFREDREDEGSPIARAFAGLLDRLVPVYGLYRFDRKFNPRWRKRRVVYRGLLDWPFILVAAFAAESALKLSKPSERKARGKAAVRRERERAP